MLIATPDGAKIQVNLARLMQKWQKLMGTVLRVRPLAEKAKIASGVWRDIWPMLECGQIRPVTYQTLKLSEAPTAHRIMESRQHIGKIILTVG